MRKLFLLAIVALLGSCKTDVPENNPLEIQTVSIENNYGISIITIEGCEYVKYSKGYQGSVTHKGNCKNPIHWKVITR